MRNRATSHPQNDTLQKQVEKAVSALRIGGVISIPTDTLYGLSASAVNSSAVNRVYQIKKRPKNMPLPILLADFSDISKYCIKVPKLAWDIAKSFLPGPLTLVLNSSGILPDIVRGGGNTIAIRIPNHWVPRTIVRTLGSPIVGTSANHSGMPNLTTAEEVRKQFGKKIDYVINDGKCPEGVASTVLDISSKTPLILRSGAISHKMLEKACGTTISIMA